LEWPRCSAWPWRLSSTYGLDFDPRNFDQTEPYFYLGKVRTYPQYWVDGQCPPGQAN
jgi:hypothetical protein